MSEATPELVGQVLAETYKIERLLGEGGMGAVYEASHSRLRRRFAVKMLYPGIASKEEVAARFRREALITSELGHPHIVEVVDFNHTKGGAPYIVMELLQGRDLGSLLEAEAPLDLPRAAGIILQVASALQAAHQRGIIHRDLKPPNIFLCSQAEYPDFVKVVDFGISKVVGSQSVVTHTQATMGTPSYMAPEQAEGRAAEVDARTDVFALSTILYEMLAGRPPFFGEAIPTMLYKIVHQEPPRLRELNPDVPPPLEAVIHKAMNKRPDDRYDSMEKFAHEFETVLEQLGVSLRMAPGAETQPAVTKPNGEQLTPAVVQQSVAAVTGQPASHTTLSGSAGEVHATAVTPPRSRTGLMVGIIAVGLLLGVGAVVLAIKYRSTDAPTQTPVAAAADAPTSPTKQKVPTPVKVAKPAKAPSSPTPVKVAKPAKAPSSPTRVEVKKPATRSGSPPQVKKPVPPKSASPTPMSRIKVMANDPQMRCTLTRTGSTRAQSSGIPCVFAVPRGSEVTLKVERQRYRPYVRRFVVPDRGWSALVELNSTLGRVELARPRRPAVPKKKSGWDFP